MSATDASYLAAWLLAVSLPALALPAQPPSDDSAQRGKASGTLSPTGPPEAPPSRTDAGDGCIVDLTQRYRLSGSLAGNAEVDYRILVHGPCAEAAPGRFAEEWIAAGTFEGKADGEAVSCRFSYTARVEAGGDVEGELVLGQGLAGTLRVQGNLGDGRLTYRGELTK